MGFLKLLFGRKPAPKRKAAPKKSPQGTAPKKQPNRRAKHKVYPIFQAEYCSDYDWQRMDIDRKNPAGFMQVKGAGDIAVEGLNIDNRAEAFFTSFDISTAELEIRRDPENAADKNALAVFGKPEESANAEKIGYVPAPVAAQLAEEFTDALPLKARLRAIGQKSNGQAAFVRFALLYPKAAERKPFLKTP